MHTYTYNEYLVNPPKIEKPFELVNGEVVIMPSESHLNVYIAMQLLQVLASKFGIERISNKTEIITGGLRVTSRMPDLVVFDTLSLEEIKNKNTSIIDLDMLPPLLVVEVVSPGEEAKKRDYRYKRSEYAARGIQYYWIIDPQQELGSFLQLNNGVYELYKEATKGIVKFNSLYNLEIDINNFWRL